MAAAAPDLIREILEAWVAPRLREAGYKKEHHTWLQEHGDLIRVLNVQLGKYNEARAAEFTINLGVFHPGFHELIGAYEIGKSVREYDCDVRERIGFVMGRTDKWWKLTPRSKPDVVGAEIVTCIDQHALPWLQEFDDLGDCLDTFAAREDWFGVAVAAHLLGRPGVKGHLLSAIEGNPRLRPRVEEWAAEHGYLLES